LPVRQYIGQYLILTALLRPLLLPPLPGAAAGRLPPLLTPPRTLSAADREGPGAAATALPAGERRLRAATTAAAAAACAADTAADTNL
jgi:hypothetical protein